MKLGKRQLSDVAIISMASVALDLVLAVKPLRGFYLAEVVLLALIGLLTMGLVLAILSWPLSRWPSRRFGLLLGTALALHLVGWWRFDVFPGRSTLDPATMVGSGLLSAAALGAGWWVSPRLKKKHCLSILAGALAGLALAMVRVGYWPVGASQEPNLVLITLDTTRADRIENQVIAPNINEIARRGT
ncbi:MAG: hypothetical protein HN348_10150, partial [Proteobacteria bacterium]|nr:hypothetical protein [Pseudomonadota bacterium]